MIFSWYPQGSKGPQSRRAPQHMLVPEQGAQQRVQPFAVLPEGLSRKGHYKKTLNKFLKSMGSHERGMRRAVAQPGVELRSSDANRYPRL